MPYIKSDRRDELAVGNYPKTAGELNYEVTQKIIEYLVTHDLGYQTINDVVGALEGAKLEFYRRVVGTYEDRKIKENSDIYPAEIT